MRDHAEMGTLETHWLIKSSGRILGPFPMPRVVELLRSREISLLDEASSPMRRWQTIQYHDAFKEVVAQLRRIHTSEKTEATWTPTGVTSNLTQTLTDISELSLTEEHTDDLGFSNTASEIVVHNVQEQPAKVPAPHSGRFQPQQGHSTAVQRKVDQTTRGLWVVIAVILVILSGYIVQKRWGQSGRVERMSAAEFKQSVLANIQVGQLTEALRSLKTYYSEPTQAGDLALSYGTLLLHLEGQTVVARRLLNLVLASRESESLQAYTSLGVAELIDGQLEPAQKYFDKALTLDSRFTPALINSAVLASQRSEFAKAKTLAIKALQHTPNSGEALLTLADAQLILFKNNQNLGDLTRVKQMISDYQAKRHDFASEIGFYGVYFAMLSKDPNLDGKLGRYLDQDPQLTRDYKHNLFIYKSHTHWKNLARHCEQVVEKMGNSARVNALMAACYSHELRWDQARRHIETAVQQAPKDALIQAWYSYILRESGEGEQASVVLSRAAELNRSGEFILPILLQARFCATSMVIDCAQASWQHLYERNMEYPPAIAGLAWINAGKGFHSAARTHLEKGLSLAPDYIPFLLLKQRAEREGWYATR